MFFILGGGGVPRLSSHKIFGEFDISSESAGNHKKNHQIRLPAIDLNDIL